MMLVANGIMPYTPIPRVFIKYGGNQNPITPLRKKTKIFDVKFFCKALLLFIGKMALNSAKQY